MKRKLFIFIALFVSAMANSQNIANIIADEKYWDESTMDAAYIEPLSTLTSTKWHHKRQDMTLELKTNGTFVITLREKIEEVHFNVKMSGTWSRNKDTFKWTINHLANTITLDKDDMTKLSQRKQDQYKTVANAMKREMTKKARETKTQIILRLDKDYFILGNRTNMGIATTDVFFSDKKIQTDAEEAKAKEEAEEKARIEAEETKSEEVDDDRILDMPEESAMFPGDVYAWLAKNIHYPPICAQQNIQGRVSVEFIINKDGSISDIKVRRSPDDHLSKEAERVVKAMPKWKPARENGKPVRMRYVLPVMFRLS